MRVAVKLFDETKRDCFERESIAYHLLENYHGDAVPMVYGIYTFRKEGGSECQDRKVMTSQRRLKIRNSSWRCGDAQRVLRRVKKLLLRLLIFMDD
ncbi:hypothetical protein BT69DRAFT_1286843 [Atractiella rhizophila]|nr:hypothetical protein BT69DRAFT_1286843 [Atractiella rhizophila]